MSIYPHPSPTLVPLYVRGAFSLDRLSRLGVKSTTNPPLRSIRTTTLNLKFPVSPKFTSGRFGCLIRLMPQNTRNIPIVHQACTACGIPMADPLIPSPLFLGVLSWAVQTRSSRFVRYMLPWRINTPGIKRPVTRGRYETYGSGSRHQ